VRGTACAAAAQNQANGGLFVDLGVRCGQYQHLRGK
jgi:hypothetical protein